MGWTGADRRPLEPGRPCTLRPGRAARRSEPETAPGRDARRRSAAGRGRRRDRQDPGHHPADRLADRHATRAKPSEILALTFTDKAADEMQLRVDQLVPYGYTDSTIATFHAFGDRLIREFAMELGLPPDVRVLSRPETVIFLREHLFDFELERTGRSAIRRASSARSPRSSAGSRTRTSTRGHRVLAEADREVGTAAAPRRARWRSRRR